MTEGMLKMMGVFSELERNMISQRVKSGLQNAKAKGKQLGRPTTSTDDIPNVFYKHRQKKNGFLFFFCLFRFSYVLIFCLSFNQLGFVIFISYVAGTDNVPGLELNDFKFGGLVYFFIHIHTRPFRLIRAKRRVSRGKHPRGN